ncbi:LOG family protein [Candidatus Bathyarchaeota archaeon]|nr:LOG family protein [Candidatus Bathyarchaeota archaeon]
METSKKACIFGSYLSLDKHDVDVVELGKQLARKGITVVTGGFGGTMEQVSKGAKEAGGKTIGVTCYVFKGVKKLQVNDHVDEEIVASSLFDRITKMIEISNAFIVLPGGTGTFVELAAVLEHVNKGLCEPKPILFLGAFWKPISIPLSKREVTMHGLKEIVGASSCADLMLFCETIDELVIRLVELL